MTAAFASLPLLAVVGLMLGLRWRAAYAALAGLALAVALAVGPFGLGVARLSEFGPAMASVGAMLEAGFATISILWIIFPALMLYELQSRSGALLTLRAAVGQVSAEPRVQVVLIAWFFGLFMEGAAGFGTPVALTAPLLVGLGYGPARAVALALIGHGAGVSFGALGTPVLAQAALGAIPAAEIARETALLNAAVGWSLLAALVWLAGDRRPTRPDWAMAAAAGACFYTPYLALALWVGPELPTAGGALIGGAAFAVVMSLRGGSAAPIDGRQVIRAVLPYAIIVALILASRLIPLVSETLRSVAVAWSIGGVFRGELLPLYHPGAILLAGLILGGMAQGRSLAQVAAAAAAAAGRLIPVAAALFAMLALSRVMVHAGMIGALAAAAAATGGVWPLLAPFTGVLGTFVTGSATASNILLTPFQSGAAAALNLPPATMAAAQGLGAGIGNIICPHNIIAGSATVGLKGGEGEVLRLTLGICLLAAGAGGALILWLIA